MLNLYHRNKKKNLNFIFEGSAQLKPFYFDGKLLIKDKKIDLIIDNLLSKLYLYDEKFVGNFNGILKIRFDKLDNKKFYIANDSFLGRKSTL